MGRFRSMLKEREVEQPAALTDLIAHIQAAARHTIYEGVAKVEPSPSFAEFQDHYAGMLLSEAVAILSMKSWDDTGRKPDPTSARAAFVRLAQRLSKIATNMDSKSEYVVAVLRKDRP